ncbi:hypothetical protein PHA77_07775 [Edwardsiella tarda]|uniref:hypothetical protein n=1 Tax=Edwardsiella tarda TaxID=636 RepID=UPI002444236B|nr:hypothetical protein [Edwardsiella tarda]WGE30490.1 hypothetical protein PHA77_07775 [Edwardsiella tarda]
MIDNRTASAIDLALQKYDTPVGPVFVAEHHGRMKKCFSRDTAIRYLAFFMTSHTFERSGFQQRYLDAQEIHPKNPEINRSVRGSITFEYFRAHQRCIRRLRRILARKREMQKWCEKWDSMHDRFVKEVNALKASKPAEVRNGSHSI